MNRNIKYNGLRERSHYEDIVHYLAIDKPKTTTHLTEKQLY